MHRGGSFPRRVSETPTPTGLEESTAVHLQFVPGVRPPFCIAVLSWPLSFEERETPQNASHSYCSTPPHLYGSTPPISTAVLLEKYWGLGSPERF